MPSYTYELQEPGILLSNIRQGLVALGGDWVAIAPLMREGHVEYKPIRVNPMRSGYRYEYKRAKLDLNLYFPEAIFEKLHAFLDGQKLEVLKAVVQASLHKRSGYDIHAFKILGIIEEVG